MHSQEISSELVRAQTLLKKAQHQLSQLVPQEYAGILGAEQAIHPILEVVEEAQQVLFELDLEESADPEDGALEAGVDSEATDDAKGEESGGSQGCGGCGGSGCGEGEEEATLSASMLAFLEQKKDLEQFSRLLEKDVYLAAARGLPPGMDGKGPATENQEHFLSAAMVAMEAHLMTEPTLEMLMEMARLNIFRREIKSARQLLRKVVEVDPEGIGVEAERLWQEVNQDSSIKDKSRCFIATAAAGDPDHPDVEALRRFRDRSLVRRPWGRKFVAFYYRYSPAVAAVLSKSRILARTVHLLGVHPAAGLVRRWEKTESGTPQN